MTGSMPGIAASTIETWLFGAAPNAVDEPENSFEAEATWACTSMPTTTSQSPVAPGIRLLVLPLPPLVAVFCMVSFLDVQAQRLRNA